MSLDTSEISDWLVPKSIHKTGSQSVSKCLNGTLNQIGLFKNVYYTFNLWQCLTNLFTRKCKVSNNTSVIRYLIIIHINRIWTFPFALDSWRFQLFSMEKYFLWFNIFCKRLWNNIHAPDLFKDEKKIDINLDLSRPDTLVVWSL